MRIHRSWSSIIPALAAFVCVLAAGGLFRAYASGVMARRPDLGPPVPVVVTTGDHLRGTTLGPEMLAVRELPSQTAPPGAFGSVEEVAGRMLAADLTTGEAVTRTRLAAPGAGLLAGLAPPGYRAVLTPTAMPPGTLRTGDVVDVVATFGGNRPHTETLLFQTEILLTLEPDEEGGITGGGDAAGTNGGVSLVLPALPEAAGRIAFAGAFATITVAVSGSDQERRFGIPTPSAYT